MTNWSDFQRQENYTQYLANKCRKKNTAIDQPKKSLKSEKSKTMVAKKGLLKFWNKNIMNRPATLYEILLVKVLNQKISSGNEPYHKMSPLKHPDAGGVEVFFNTINWAYQILKNDAAQEAYNIFGLEEPEKLMNDKNWWSNYKNGATKLLYSKTF